MNDVNNGKYKLVDWRVWRWPGLVREWHANWQAVFDKYIEGERARGKDQAVIEELTERLAVAEDELAVHRSVNGMRAGLKRAPVGAKELAAMFEGVHGETGWWRCLNDLLERQGREESGLAIVPEVNGEVRAYRAGRAAGVEDVRFGLHQIWVKSQEEKEG